MAVGCRGDVEPGTDCCFRPALRALPVGPDAHSKNLAPDSVLLLLRPGKEANRACHEVSFDSSPSYSFSPVSGTVTHLHAIDSAVESYRAGRLADAERVCRETLKVEPGHADALHLLGLIAQRVGRHSLALDLIGAAISARPSVADYHHNLGTTLSEMGRADEAMAAFRRALEIKPDLAMAFNNIGNILKERGWIEEAIASYQRGLECEPGLAVLHQNLGAALLEQGFAEDALAECKRALDSAPELAEAYNTMGNAWQRLRRQDDAIAAFHRALALKPDYAEAHNNLGISMFCLGRHEEALASYRQALKIAPGYAMAYNNIGNVLRDEGKLDEAAGCYRRALALQPDYVEAHSNLGAALMDQGEIEAGIRCFRQALAMQPGHPGFFSNVLVALHYSPRTTLAQLFEEHCEFDRRYAAPLRSGWLPHSNAPETDRRLRVGFVSPHLAGHPVGHFLIRLLENLEATQWETFCYSDTLVLDELTARLRSAASVWREVSAITDEALTQRVRDDRVDILFDLAGHTAGNRLLAFARKPAPIQITWCDYVGTTGLAAMDYLLADPREIPPEAAPYYREKVLRMPDDYICYDPLANAPTIGPLPALASGHVTFGSFNIPQKTTPEIVRVWARILHAMPDSRLILKNRGMDDAASAGRYRRMFDEEGIAGDRVEMLGWSPPREVLECYNRVDIALDTWPYNGGLTTCEAMWMGVPVVTCPDETFASRHGLAHLSAVGVTESIATSLDDYVDKALGLAGDLARLASLRSALRERMRVSSLCDGKRFAGNFGALLRNVWREWCVMRDGRPKGWCGESDDPG